MPYKDKKRQLEYQKNWIKKRREDFFKDKICEKCGSSYKLELHHKNPKEKETHKIWSWSKEKREAELKKCVVWCEKCHISYHADLMKVERHGANNMYNKGCRCDLCREFKSQKNKRFRNTPL